MTGRQIVDVPANVGAIGVWRPISEMSIELWDHCVWNLSGLLVSNSCNGPEHMTSRDRYEPVTDNDVWEEFLIIPLPSHR